MSRGTDLDVLVMYWNPYLSGLWYLNAILWIGNLLVGLVTHWRREVDQTLARPWPSGAAVWYDDSRYQYIQVVIPGTGTSWIDILVTGTCRAASRSTPAQYCRI